MTIKDVARAANVSISTVSRALNRPAKVDPAVVTRVRATADALCYVPHQGARSLVSRRFNAIGSIVPTIDNAIFAKATQTLQTQLNARGYTLLLASTEYDAEREVAEVHALIEQGVDGIVLVGAEHPAAVERLLRTRNVTFINTWVYDPKSKAPCIGFDNRAAMARISSYLLELGHRDIAMVAGVTRHNDRASQRVEGVRETLASRSLSIHADRMIECPYTIADGRRAAARLLAQPTPPTAIICGNDVIAYGVLFECFARGVRVPEALSVTGFDDLELSEYMEPPLTTMRVPAAEMGVRAANFLLARGGKHPIAHRIELVPEFIIRGTTAPPRSTRKRS